MLRMGGSRVALVGYIWDLDKCWLMSLIDTLGTLSMEDVVERDHGHTTTHHPPPVRYEAEARPC